MSVWPVVESVEVVLGFVLAVIEIFQMMWLWRMSDDIEDIQEDIEGDA